MTESQQRRKQFKKVGQALSALDQAWAERRGESFREYRNLPSGKGGPTVMQLSELFDRRTAKRKPEPE